MLTITDNAAEAVRQIAAGSGLEPDPGLRISAGSPTAEGTPLELSLAASAEATDQTVEEHGARVYLEEPVALALDDKILDAAVVGDRVRFEIRTAPTDGANGAIPAT
jgi:Fe-S cluster assembly iron-binding protein IscA